MPLTGTFIGQGIAPQVTGGAVVTRSRVRVDFSETMARATVSAPANFSITAGGGGVVRTVTGATPATTGDPLSVYLDLDGPMSIGPATYTVAALAGTLDSAGTATDPAHNSVVLTAGAIGAIDVSNAGGDIVTLTLNLLDGLYFVDVGLNPGVSSVRAYSGISGNGPQALSRGGVLTFVMPPASIADGYEVRATPVGGGGATTTGPVLNVVARQFFSTTYELRRKLPPLWNARPLKIEDEVYPQ